MLFYSAAFVVARRHRRNEPVRRWPRPSLIRLLAGEMAYVVRRVLGCTSAARRRRGRAQTSPSASIAPATRRKPAMFAPVR